MEMGEFVSVIKTENVRRVVQRARLTRWAQWTARIRGWRDGRSGLPHVPPPGPLPVGQESTVTPYIREQRATARRAVEQLRSRLLHRQQRLITDIRYQAAQVVAQYDARRQPAPAALARFGARVGEWHAEVDVCRHRAAAVHEQVNQQIAGYWDAVRRHHRDVPDPAPAHLDHWAPAPLELDPSWHRPDSWLADPAAGTGDVTARALELLGRQGQAPGGA